MDGKMSRDVNYSSRLHGIIDRVEQRDSFTDVVGRIGSGMPFTHNLFEWYGAPGIGKTMLVTLLANECKQRGIPSILITFDKTSSEKVKTYLKDPIHLLEELLPSLSQYGVDTSIIKEKIHLYHQSALPPEGVCSAYAHMTEKERSYSNLEWLLGMRSVLGAFTDAISTLTKDDGLGHIRPLALFIDGIDHADGDEFLANWLEEFVVKPLVQSKKCVVVWTARHEWRWKRPEIRWDRISEELHAFNESEVKEQLNQSPRFKKDSNLAEQLFQNIHVLTGGHPFAGAVVIRQIDKWQEVNADVLKQRTGELHDEINKHFIKNYVFKDLSADQRTALELCSMVRLIDGHALQVILQGCSGGKYNDWQREQFDQLRLELSKTFLLRWSNGGWTLESSLRHLIRSYYLSCAPEMFKRVNEIALEMYQDWLKKNVDRKLFIVEEIYHYLSLQQLDGNESDIIAVLEKRLEEYPSFRQEDKESWQHTLEQIEGGIEHDEDIVRLVGEEATLRITEPVKKRLRELNKKQ